MSQSKEEQRAYLEGSLAGLNEAYQLGPHLQELLESLVAKKRKKLAALDIPQLKEHYGTDRVEIPSPWEWDETFATPNHERPVFGGDHEAHTDLTYLDKPRLGLRKRKPTRVWFEAEEKPRNPKIGDWILYHGGWHQVIEITPFAYVCAIRHEEYDQEPQVVTQADVDRVLGGGK